MSEPTTEAQAQVSDGSMAIVTGVPLSQEDIPVPSGNDDAQATAATSPTPDDAGTAPAIERANPTAPTSPDNPTREDAAPIPAEAGAGATTQSGTITAAEIEAMDLEDLNDMTDSIAQGRIKVSYDEPAPEPEPEPEPAPVAEAPPEPTPEPVEETPAPADDFLAKNWRVKPANELDAQAIAIYKEDPSIGMTAAIALAEKKLGIAPDANPLNNPPKPVVEEVLADVESLIRGDAPKTEAEARALHEELLAEFKKAKVEEYDVEREADIQIALARIPFTIADIKASEAKQAQLEQEEQTSFATAQADADARAMSLYPDAANANSALAQAAIDVSNRLADAGDPLLSQPDSGLRIMQMAARELGIAPKSSQSVAPASPAAPVSQSSAPLTPTIRRVASPPVLAPASAGTTHPGANAPSVLDQKIAAATTTEDLIELEQMMLRAG